MNTSTSQEPTVYVVDGDPAALSALCETVEASGLQFQSFRSAEEFLRQFRNDPAGCLVTELALPGMGGLELQHRLRDADSRLSVIISTGSARPGAVASAMKQGAFDLLEKPVDRTRAMEIIRAALARNATARREQMVCRHLFARRARLTPRECEVMSLVVRGLSNKQIAMELSLSEKTIEIHRGRVMHKMLAGSLAELVRMAVMLGECPPLAIDQPADSTDPCVCTSNTPA